MIYDQIRRSYTNLPGISLSKSNGLLIRILIQIQMPSTDPYDPEVLIELDGIATEKYVVDFLNSQFRELEDLEKLNSTLVELKEIEQSLNEKVI
jgi:hypothetical protein